MHHGGNLTQMRTFKPLNRSTNVKKPLYYCLSGVLIPNQARTANIKLQTRARMRTSKAFQWIITGASIADL